MDEKYLEQAANLELAHREAAIHRAGHQAQPPKNFDGEHCVACDEPIPQARLALGKWRCLYCQTLYEKYKK